MKDFSVIKEVQPYLNEPKAMYVGAPGKRGVLKLGFELDAEGKSIMRDWFRNAPLIVQQELYFDEEMPEMPCVYILSSGGPNVDGDRYEQEFTVRKNAYAFISTGASTKIAEMIYNYSGMTQTFLLEENAYLEYLPEPLIPCHNSRFICDTTITLHPSATLFYSEVYMPGRTHYREGERFLYDIISVCTRAERPDGGALFREKFIVRPKLKSPERVGIMDNYDVFANVLVLTPKNHLEALFEKTKAFIDKEKGLAAGITRLPNGCGLLYKVLGKETEPVKKIIREFCSSVRMEVKGKSLPAEFPWR
ncbi:MAG: urease accessory protein UreD [Paludibacteraceae bacterium]|nr:urease accessory protein UreD [Prevotellaceae bacterium]